MTEGDRGDERMGAKMHTDGTEPNETAFLAVTGEVAEPNPAEPARCRKISSLNRRGDRSRPLGRCRPAGDNQNRQPGTGQRS